MPVKFTQVSSLMKEKATARADGSKLLSTQDQYLSFGCECTVCKTHLSNMRRAGDLKAIKAFQDEVKFRTFAHQRNSLERLQNKNTENGSQTKKDFSQKLIEMMPKAGNEVEEDNPVNEMKKMMRNA